MLWTLVKVQLRDYENHVIFVMTKIALYSIYLEFEINRHLRGTSFKNSIQKFGLWKQTKNTFRLMNTSDKEIYYWTFASCPVLFNGTWPLEKKNLHQTRTNNAKDFASTTQDRRSRRNVASKKALKSSEQVCWWLIKKHEPKERRIECDSEYDVFLSLVYLHLCPNLVRSLVVTRQHKTWPELLCVLFWWSTTLSAIREWREHFDGIPPAW